MWVGESGAVDQVIKKDEVHWFPLEEKVMSKAGMGFTAANGLEFRKYGGRLLSGRTENKEGFNMSVQVIDARNNLASFTKMEEEGNDIMSFKKKDCFITNGKTGLKMPMRVGPGGTPEFDLWLKKRQGYRKFGVFNANGEADISENGVSAFQRLGDWV